MANRPHPEMGYRDCLGIIRLPQKYAAQRVEAASERALLTGACRYKSVESILRNSLDQSTPSPPSPSSTPSHDNIRAEPVTSSEGRHAIGTNDGETDGHAPDGHGRRFESAGAGSGLARAELPETAFTKQGQWLLLHNRKASVATLRSPFAYGPDAVRVPFGISVHLRWNPQLEPESIDSRRRAKPSALRYGEIKSSYTVVVGCAEFYSFFKSGWRSLGRRFIRKG